MTKPKTPAASPPDRRAAQVKPAGAASPPPPTGEAAGTTSSPLCTEAPQAAVRMPVPVTGSRTNPPVGEPDRERANTCNTASRGAKILAAGSPKTPAGGAGASPAPSAGLQAAAAKMSEDRGPDSLDAHVRRYMTDLGLLRYHTHDARRSPEGFPDLVCVGPGGVLFRELKRQGKDPTPVQQRWLDALDAAGADADTWRPEDFYSGRIANELIAVAGLRVAAS